MYKGAKDFVYATTMMAIMQINRGADNPDFLLEVADRVGKMAESEYLTKAQIRSLYEALDISIEIPEEEPETTEEGLTLQDVADGMAELSELVSELMSE